ncbi:helix-turn-helix domain-containing protein [Sulfurovum lithotrophicum]|uniref:helix-turn-helix domain-containing protein n=1 Tax=Sulfurovum lithotrophicum TaxID=206403 RepID=UPI000AA0762A|nr:AraC family transcriptional regulator [Sulfurovum lithotrophicum]
MTVTIPNYMIERNEPTLVHLGNDLYLEQMRTHTQKILVRNTMHGLTLVESGYKEVEMNTQSTVIEKEHAVFFAQGNYFSNQNSSDYRTLTLFFDDTYIINLLKKYRIAPQGTAKRIEVIPYGTSDTIRILIESIQVTAREKKPHFKTLLKLKTELLFLEFYQHAPRQLASFFQHVTETSNERMRYILEENIDILYTVTDMHTLLRMGPSHFHTQFVKHFGVSPKTWLDKKRMEKAMFLLTSSEKSIKEIAAECGYSTSSWFIVQFKKYCKTTPREFRVENRYK